MKKINIKHIALGVSLSLCVCTSCDYLDVVPPEQAEVSDTMKDAEDAINFINSCYRAVELASPFPYSTFEWSTDESVDPPLWNGNNQKTAWNLWSETNASGNWDNFYNYLGHCHMFLRVLDQYEPAGATEKQKAEWRAEAEFLKAYYHFRLLSMYGPIPIVDERLPQSTLPEEFPGRSHFDYVIDYICNQKLSEENINALPATRGSEDWGRATKAAALALKGRALLYAASELWNGGFPYPNWKNTNYETPGYGYELVSRTKDMNKWTLALNANKEALTYAENEGERKLIDLDNLPSTLTTIDENHLPYIPGMDNTTEEGKEFAERVLMLRTITSSFENQGNTETIWGVFQQGGNQYLNFASWPKRILCYNEAQNKWVDGWCAISPTLYSIEHFYTKNGKLPEHDPNFPQSDYEKFSSAGISGREEVIRLNVGREPRFYANFSFDGDDYSSVLKDGEPFRVNLRDANAQGYNPDLFNRDYTVTGYFNKKYIAPELVIDGATGTDNRENYPRPIFRLAELYLNVAECYAELGDIPGALQYLNPIRKRAGVPELTQSDVTSEMSIIDWVRAERFIELWGEGGHRYYDLRRWMIAPQQLKAGAREGLNVEGAGMNPTFENLNQRTVVNQQFQWDNRMYLWPIKSSEIYNDPQLIQAPGY